MLAAIASSRLARGASWRSDIFGSTRERLDFKHKHCLVVPHNCGENDASISSRFPVASSQIDRGDLVQS